MGNEQQRMAAMQGGGRVGRGSAMGFTYDANGEVEFQDEEARQRALAAQAFGQVSRQDMKSGK